jgi:hypothetical protein
MRVTTRYGSIAVTIGVAALALVGCSSQPDGTSPPTTTVTATTTPAPAGGSATATPAASAAAAPSGSSSAGSSGGSADAGAPADGGTASGAGTCTVASLAGSITFGGGGGAGSQYQNVALRNTGSASCTLQGWPGVSFVGGGDGRQLGAAATLDRGTAHPTVTLAPGATAYAGLRIVQAANLAPGACTQQTPDGFRVYPPGSKQALFIPSTAYKACSETSAQLLSVRAFVPEGQQEQG